MHSIFIVASALLAAAVALTACGGADNKTPAGPDGGTSANETLPSDFPPDLPQYAHASVISSDAAEPGANEGANVTFETDDSLEEVKAFYAREFEAKAWLQVSNSSSSQGATFLVENGDSAASVLIREVDGDTTILITYGTKDDFGLDDSPDGGTP